MIANLLEAAGWILVLVAIGMLAGGWWSMLGAGIILVGYGMATDLIGSR